LELEGLAWAFEPYTDFIRPTGLKVHRRPYHLDEIFEQYMKLQNAEKTLEIRTYGNLGVTRDLCTEESFIAKVRGVLCIHT
jgi:hypothetical protein